METQEKEIKKTLIQQGETVEATPIWDHFKELWAYGVAVFVAAAAWGEARYRLHRLEKDHKKLQEEKTDKLTCELVHAQAREAQQMTLDTITAGFDGLKKDFREFRAESREDFRVIHRRLDEHIAQNGR